MVRFHLVRDPAFYFGPVVSLYYDTWPQRNYFAFRRRAEGERWRGSKQAYLEGVQGVRRFIAERPAIVLKQFQERFGFTECRVV